MNTLNRLMVALDLTQIDLVLIDYAAFLSAALEVEKVYFIHVEKSLELPAGFPQEGGRKEVSAGEGIRQMINSEVQPAFANVPRTEVEILVEEGTPLKELLRWSKDKEVDLMLVGRKLRLRGSGVLGQKLLRSGHLGVLFVPESYEPRLRRIVVSVDFSEYSEMALDRVLHSALARPEVHVICLNVYQVPSSYHTMGMSYEEYDTRMRMFAEDKYKKLTSHFPELRDRAELVLVRQEGNDDIGELIVMEAKRARADMLVVGAKGMTAMAHFVLGSVTEKVLRYDMDIPLLVFKNKKEDVGFLDALLGTT
ncbi:nucleotide-binding universal stress UspA family protein [Pontibacter ummariensis]|uniref:Nucleotide-binding universal stress protein, UspA family n=1 Tax=Pontibacter ummariensis TaxID=1610492 RepID=A0A239BW63_9BACT|nr:universal stress protein [Pontibacter ummariensis]PRY15596.1 nucleotide-binding universal stress UspA family protein [Pontibacter ummariensis]SNS11892.1 Nucleotide-binding universal stress protein, UspA family [Pontibacter ummariensis]